MKTLLPYLLIGAVTMFLMASHDEYEQEAAEARLEQQMRLDRMAEAHADSLNLTGQDRINFINGYYGD